ncbi:MAG TPA: hypothetical protein VHL60_00875 [Oxalicibacterium sp.]|jgi:hypothetical protein|nr:hypothetical protein [Oxalicibacterium sp.]
MSTDKSFARRIAACAALLGMLSAALPVSADPAPWFYWRSKLTNERVCAQFSPGNGWVQDGGPYKDARCANRY